MVEIRHNLDLLIECLVAIVPLNILGLHASCDRKYIVKNRLRLMSGSCEIDASGPRSMSDFDSNNQDSSIPIGVSQNLL
jgi:hypothetical protein